MSTAELKSNLHLLIDTIHDNNRLSQIYKFIFRTKAEVPKDAEIGHTTIMSESSLSKDWNRPEEDKAWESL